jgi:hypothetical protein
MQNSQKFVVGVAALIIVIGAGMYLSRNHALPPIQPLDSQNIHTETTNRPIVHTQRPSRTEEASNESNPSDPQMLRAKVDEYLRRHNRNSASLLTAFHALQDTNFLYEAATNFPNDPHVQRTVLAQNVFPEDRRKWLDAFKASSPSNSLANYLSAQDYFKNHQPDAAIKDLLAASGNSQFNNYSMDTLLDSEAFSQFSGSSPMEAHVSAMSAMAGDDLHELAGLKSLAVGIGDMQQQYLNSGDSASVQNLAQAGLLLADRLMTGDSGKFIINQLVGRASEAIVLQSLDQNTSYPFLNGETPAQRLADLNQLRTSIRQFTQNQNAVFSLSEEQQANYWERMKIYGEIPAMQWVQQQNVTTPNTGN